MKTILTLLIVCGIFKGFVECVIEDIEDMGFKDWSICVSIIMVPVFIVWGILMAAIH